MARTAYLVPKSLGLKDRLYSLATQYDQKQSTKRSHNIYALGHYFENIEEVLKEIDGGTPPERALENHFNDRLLDVLKKAL